MMYEYSGHKVPKGGQGTAKQPTCGHVLGETGTTCRFGVGE
jgi:hypothetical protein